MSMRKENKSDMAMLDLFKSFKTNAENIKLQTLQNCGTIKQKICKLCGASRFVAGVYMHCQSWSTPESSRNLLINYCSRDENTIRLIKVTGGRGRGGVGELSWTGTGSGTHWEWDSGGHADADLLPSKTESFTVQISRTDRPLHKLIHCSLEPETIYRLLSSSRNPHHRANGNATYGKKRGEKTHARRPHSIGDCTCKAQHWQARSMKPGKKSGHYKQIKLHKKYTDTGNNLLILFC